MYRHVEWGWAVSWNNDTYVVEDYMDGKVTYREGSIIEATIWNPELVKEVSDILVNKSKKNLKLLKDCSLVPVERTTVANILEYKDDE